MPESSSADIPFPVSLTEISTYSSVEEENIFTVPPSGVNFLALSARVFSMKSVSTRSALMVSSVGSTTRFMPFNWNDIRPFCTTSKVS